MAFEHTPVMQAQCLALLDPKPTGVYVDATVGGGGHALALAQALAPEGRLLCLDRDETALMAAAARLAAHSGKIIFRRGNYRRLAEHLQDAGFSAVDGVLFDLGVSSPQLDAPERGFSYRLDGALDMRMDRAQTLTARDIVNGYSKEELAGILFDYGEEPYAHAIAAAIAARREKAPIETTLQLSDAVVHALPPKARRRDGHPAKRTFQAIRIAVNDELTGLSQGLEAAIEALRPGGRLVVISFHSLEDRIVKQIIQENAAGCDCPPDFPVCVCKKKPKIKKLTKKPILPTPGECERNRRAHSAKLRAAERV